MFSLFDYKTFEFIVCKTIGGPDPYKQCVFPFIWFGEIYYGCPDDPQNSSFRWCSTKVDEFRHHVTGQGRYGYCANDCPFHPPTSREFPNSSRIIDGTCNRERFNRPIRYIRLI